MQAHNGGLCLAPRHLRAALIEVGLARVEAHASAEAYGTPERTRLVAAAFAGRAAAADFVQTVLEQGWATPAELEALPTGLLAWGERADAFLAALKCGALGWKPEEQG